jgi:putative transposase
VKRKRFNVEQIVAVRKQAEMGTPVVDLIRHLGIAEQPFSRWKQWYAGLESEQVREFKQLQDENAKLKRVVADVSLDKVLRQDVLSNKFKGSRGSGVWWRIYASRMR